MHGEGLHQSFSKAPGGAGMVTLPFLRQGFFTRRATPPPWGTAAPHHTPVRASCTPRPRRDRHHGGFRGERMRRPSGERLIPCLPLGILAVKPLITQGQYESTTGLGYGLAGGGERGMIGWNAWAVTLLACLAISCAVRVLVDCCSGIIRWGRPVL